MASEIKLTNQDVSSIKDRLKDASLQPDEKELLEALLKMAQNHPVHGEGDIAWFFNWRPPTTKGAGRS